jgi:hypothetical protein
VVSTVDPPQRIIFPQNKEISNDIHIGFDNKTSQKHYWQYIMPMIAARCNPSENRIGWHFICGNECISL